MNYMLHKVDFLLKTGLHYVDMLLASFCNLFFCDVDAIGIAEKNESIDCSENC